ncbi:uncharacterized protein [Patagioenas fasciata]|uniref:uncharacterized protein n=1 Tax=Patagioenas fasciata TaxID=372321 RepID=UPI003A9A08BF
MAARDGSAAGAGGGPGAAAPLAGAGRSPCCPRAVAVLPPGGSGGVPLVAPAVPRLKILLTPRWDRDRRQFRPGYPRPRDHKDTLVTCGQPDVTQNSQVLLAELLSSGSTPKPCCLLALVLSTPISPGFLQLLCPLGSFLPDPFYPLRSPQTPVTVSVRWGTSHCAVHGQDDEDSGQEIPSKRSFPLTVGQRQQPRYRDSSTDGPGIATAAPTAPVSRQQHRQPRYRDSSTNSPGIATAAPTAPVSRQQDRQPRYRDGQQ